MYFSSVFKGLFHSSLLAWAPAQQEGLNNVKHHNQCTRKPESQQHLDTVWHEIEAKNSSANLLILNIWEQNEIKFQTVALNWMSYVCWNKVYIFFVTTSAVKQLHFLIKTNHRVAVWFILINHDQLDRSLVQFLLRGNLKNLDKAPVLNNIDGPTICCATEFKVNLQRPLYPTFTEGSLSQAEWLGSQCASRIPG